MSQYKWILQNKISNEVYQLEKDPDGWNELHYKIYRSSTYHGVFQEPTVKQLSFLNNGGGKDFVDAAFESNDVNADVEITCLGRPHSGDKYKVVFRAKLNYVGHDKTDDYTRLNIEQNGLYQKLLAREENSVDLQTTQSIGEETITAPTPKTLSLPDIQIRLRNEWHIEDPYVSPGQYAAYPVGDASPYGGFATLNTIVKGHQMPECAPGNKKQDIATPTVTFENSTIDPIWTFERNDYVGETESFLYQYDFDVTIGIQETFFPGGAIREHTGTVAIKLSVGKDYNAVDTWTLATGGWSAAAGGGSVNLVASGIAGFNAAVGYKMWLYIEFENALTVVAVPGTVFTRLFVSPDIWKFDLLLNSALGKPVEAKSMLMHEAFNQIVDAIADSDGNFYSEFYGRTDSEKQTYDENGEGSLLAITTGLNIRMLDTPIATSLKMLFKNANALHNIGLGIVDGKIRVERKSFFYNPNSRILTLPYVEEYTVKNANTLYYNLLRAGFDRWEAEYVGGLDDPHGKREYSTKVSSIKGIYDIVSSYIASTFAIEATRRKNHVFFPDTDWRYDNEIFWLCVNDDYSIELASDILSDVNNMEAYQTAYNLRITPARMLQAHFGSIVSSLQRIQGKLTFVKGEGNLLMDSTSSQSGTQHYYNGQPLSENASLDYNDANAANAIPIWVPEEYTFDYPLTTEQLNAIQANPYGYIEFYKKANEVKRGFILEVDYNLTNSMARIRLLRMFEP
jgi:hypothetical protein